MTFSEFVSEQTERLARPLAALVALTDVALDQLPAAERAELLNLVREHAVSASAIAGELQAGSRYPGPGLGIDLRKLDAGSTAA